MANLKSITKIRISPEHRKSNFKGCSKKKSVGVMSKNELMVKNKIDQFSKENNLRDLNLSFC
jgi:hypothetical protein